MRKLFLIATCLIGVLAMFATLPDDNIDNDLRHILPDSIFSNLRNLPLLLYTYGHHGCAWSIITRDTVGFKAISGFRREADERHTISNTEENRFDTLGFFRKNKELIDWGFDSLSNSAKKMRPTIDTVYNPGFSSLKVINNSHYRLFDSKNAPAFSGPDSIAFNEKLTKLEVMMLWISFPEIRPYLPDSLFCSKILLESVRSRTKIHNIEKFQTNIIENYEKGTCANNSNTIKHLETATMNAFLEWAYNTYKCKEPQYVFYLDLPNTIKTENVLFQTDEHSVFYKYPQYNKLIASKVIKSGYIIVGLSTELNSQKIEIAIKALIPESTTDKICSFIQYSGKYEYILKINSDTKSKYAYTHPDTLAIDAEPSVEIATQDLIDEISEDYSFMIDEDGFLDTQFFDYFSWKLSDLSISMANIDYETDELNRLNITELLNF